MTSFASGARRLPPHHVTIRVPWHDQGWNGSVCAKPLANTSCLALPRIGSTRDDNLEVECAGRSWVDLKEEQLPPCVAERAGFMAPFELHRTMEHPYARGSSDTHGHFKPTPYRHPAYSAACVPFRWMLRNQVEGDAKSKTIGLSEKLDIGWQPDREPEMGFDTAWVQEAGNQLALLDTFFSALRPDESLCFFYAKRTPLSEQPRRVIIGVGKVLSVGTHTPYLHGGDDSALDCVLWERNVSHSIRPEFTDGFLFPYAQLLEGASGLSQEELEELVAFAPDEHFAAYSYGSELLTHDGAVASLISCAAALERMSNRVEGPWKRVLGWVDSQLNRLWTARGAFPGLGSALSAFGYEWGFQHGSLLAYELELELERRGDVGGDPWPLLDAVMSGSETLNAPVANRIPANSRKGWASMRPERRALLQLLSRCTLTEEQALRFFDSTMRGDSGIDATDAELLANPYLLFEQDRRNVAPIYFTTMDRGLFPDEAIRASAPLPSPSLVDDPSDFRRVRGLVGTLLEEAAGQGHSLLPRDWVIRRARDRALQPPCPLGESVLDAAESSFAPIVDVIETDGAGLAYQIDRLVECRHIIRREVRARKKGKRHQADFDWRELVDQGLGEALPEAAAERKLEELAREEKAAGLRELVQSRLSVLIGSAGTGKTTLLRMLCAIPEVSAGGILLLAPTGKARVRLEQQTGLRGSGQTLAQLLNRLRRYDGNTGAYFPNAKGPKTAEAKTVIVDEASMLTEEQLAALFDACGGVERYVLVGDPQQLPPIGAGRPFVDIVTELAPEPEAQGEPEDAPGYAELTIPRRQTAADREDMMLAAHFTGAPLDPAADEVWDLASDGGTDRLRFVQWSTPEELQARVMDEIASALGLAGPDDELGFELSLGGTPFGEMRDRAFFWSKFRDNPGAAARVDAWQLLSPVRAGLEGVEALNRAVQDRFRRRWREKATAQGWGRKVPKPFGAQAILYGDKVINVRNQNRRDVWPKPETEPYLANGDLGMVVGQYKTKKFKGLPWKLEVEFSGQLGHKYGFKGWEFSEDANDPLELAYALTVHKTQGSEFGLTFVVIPNPCRLLSRELLYTAVTRHREKVVILHQGPLTDLRRFAGTEYSEIARRMTNLFDDPRPTAVPLGTGEVFLEQGLIHRTERGELVRSKSELVIADKLHARRVDYAYEQQLVLPSGKTRYPDFTIADHASGITYVWEHLGMLRDPAYRRSWERKKEEYRAAGILPHDEGGGPEGTLIETYDDEHGGLDASRVAHIIDNVIL
jgi:AAA domain-containing protein/UvrD-like helicase family protein